MGGGGGGAGGAVRLAAATSAVIGTNRITVAGAGGGRATCGARGGNGAMGRVGVRATDLSGSTSPALVRLLD